MNTLRYKTWISNAMGVALLMLMCLPLAGCHDDALYTSVDDEDSDYVTMELTICLPEAPAGSSRYSSPANGLDEGTFDERKIDPDYCYLLVYNEDKEITDVINVNNSEYTDGLEGDNGSLRRTVKLKFAKSDKQIYIRMLAPMNNRKDSKNYTYQTSSYKVIASGLSIYGTDVTGNTFYGNYSETPDTKLKESLVGIKDDNLDCWYELGGENWFEMTTSYYNNYYNNGRSWYPSNDNGYIPMQSVLQGPYSLRRSSNVSLNLYRCMSKVVFKSNCDFKISKIYTYNFRKVGNYFSQQTCYNDISRQFETAQPITNWFAVEGGYDPKGEYLENQNPAVDGWLDGEASIDKDGDISVYLPEIPTKYIVENNLYESPSTRKDITHFWVFGTYGDDTEELGSPVYLSTDGTKESLEGTGNGSPLDLVRNHIYVFGINKVTVTDDNYAYLEVQDYTPDQYMRGINRQYTLEVDCSSFNFDGLVVYPNDLNISTDGTAWQLEIPTDEAGSGFDGSDPWLTVEETYHTYDSGTVSILPNAFVNIDSDDEQTRQGWFYITAGDIRKKIVVNQKFAETANSYIIGRPGTYLLKTDVRGNGRTTGWGDDSGSTLVNLDYNLSANIEGVHDVQIIWETSQGLITIPDPEAINTTTGCIAYQVNSVVDQWGYSVFYPGHGGNALLGAFDASGNLLWSWHIWVVGDYSNGVTTERWVTGVDMMDRYLGAYSSEPGVRAYGLLYQWGRKDPFPAPDYEGDEPEFYKVPKQRYYNYTVHGRTYNWYDWADNTYSAGQSETPVNAIAHPTTLMASGFLNATDNDAVRKALWGTSSSSVDVPDAGVKTMWDPCPVGYRMPSVHSYLFGPYPEDPNLYEDYYHQNNVFVPCDEGFPLWGYNGAQSGAWAGLLWFTVGLYQPLAPFYGFWINYNTHKASGTFPFLNSNFTSPTIGGMTFFQLNGIYDGTLKHFGACGNFTTFSKYTADEDATEVGPDILVNSKSVYSKASSIHVNSFVWLNAPAQANTNRPAALFMHGQEGLYYPTKGNVNGEEIDLTQKSYSLTASHFDMYYLDESGEDATIHKDFTGHFIPWIWEDDGSTEGRWVYLDGSNRIPVDNPSVWSYQSGINSCRDLHKMNENRWSESSSDQVTDLLAHPNWAGAIRPVADKDHVKEDEIVIDRDEVTLYDGNNYAITVNIDSPSSWQVTDPGARWLKIVPDRGNAGISSMTISYDSTYANYVTDTTVTVKIKFAYGTEKTITVTLTL